MRKHTQWTLLMFLSVAGASVVMTCFSTVNVPIFSQSDDLGAADARAENVLWPASEATDLGCTTSAQPEQNVAAGDFCKSEWKYVTGVKSVDFYFNPLTTVVGGQTVPAVCPAIAAPYKCTYMCPVQIAASGNEPNYLLSVSTYAANSNTKGTDRAIILQCDDGRYVACGTSSADAGTADFGCPLPIKCKPVSIQLAYVATDCIDINGGGTWNIGNLRIMAR